MPLISLSSIYKEYLMGGIVHTILKDVSLTVLQGEMLAIVGASGSGKSTLMNLIGLLDKADKGRYCFKGRDVALLSANETAYLRNQSLGFVFQQFNLLPRFNALQNVGLPLIYRQLSPVLIQEKALNALAHVGMENFAYHLPSQLSGGQQQRVAIARALVGEPQIILADEPTGALDSATSNEIIALFSTLHKEGCTLILITHDKTVARHCSREITLADGRIIREIKR